MDLSESQNSEDSDDLWVEFVDTSDSDDEGEAGLSWDVNLSGELGLSTGSDLCLLCGEVISLILLSTLEDLSSLVLVVSSSLLSQLLEGSGNLRIACFLLDEAFWLRGNNLLSWHHHKRIYYI